jgi:hypothetical protein
MVLKQTTSVGLSEQQRLERLTKLCEELQAAVDRAGDQRRLLEEMKQVAQQLLSDAESKPMRKPAAPKK